MNTPEKNKIGTPVTKFEDSPVFNYINSLSPIKPVKSQHITQTFSSLSFASLPSVFTSPHVNPNKESRFLLRCNISDLSKPELSSENRGKDCAIEEDNIIYDNTLSAQNEDSSVLTVNAGVSSVDQLDYDCVSTPQPRGPEEDFGSELVNPSDPVDHGCAEISAEKGLSESEMTRYHELCLSDHRKDGAVCDWESLISDSADILIFDSPNCSEAFKALVHNSIEPVTRLCATKIAGQGNVNSDHQQHQQAREEFYPRTEDGSQLSDFEPIQDMFYNGDMNPSERKEKESEAHVAFSCKSVLSLHRGIRRRCLDFETAGGRRRVIDEEGQNSNSDSKITAESSRLGSSLRRLLPGIGLHLNALAAASKDSNNNNNSKISNGEDLPAAIRIRNISIGQEPLIDKSLDSNSNENGVQVLQDSGGSLASEELNQNSPKKKRRKMENAGEPDGCKRCNCKKSKCLKLYCECFAAGVYCIEPCSCQECFNKPIHEDTVLSTRKQIESRNPLAFAPKVIRNSESVPEYGHHQDESSKTPASARHKRGCNCKKSSCLKKYCECYQGGVGCSVNCRCEGCKNAFGRKDGSSTLIDMEPDHDEEEQETSEKSFADKTSLTIEELNPSAALPITPLQMPRPVMVPIVPFSSKGKPPLSSFITVGSSSSGLYGPKHSSRPSILRSQPSKFGKPTETAKPDDSEMLPEILLEDPSPVTGIKSLSPNSKRISPPQCLFGSPGRRSGRKLILQSIPSFPSLTPHE